MLLRCRCDAGDLNTRPRRTAKEKGEREAGGDWGQFRGMLPLRAEAPHPGAAGAWATTGRAALAFFPVLPWLPFLQATLWCLASTG